MKKIYSFILLASLCFGVASCSDDKGEATPLSTIKVLAAETSFESAPSKGKVVVDCNPMAAYVGVEDRNWLDVQVDKDTVKLSAKRNISNESRNAMLVIKKNAKDSVMLNVDQKGLIFIVQDKQDIMQHNDLSQSYSFKISSSIQGQILSAPSWIDASMTMDKLSINVTENNEGHIREGFVKYNCGSVTDSIKVTQFELEKDLLGEYELWIDYDEKTDLCTSKLPVNIQSTENGSVTMNFTALYKNTNVNFQFPMTFDADSLSFSIGSGQCVASFKDKKNKWTYFYAIFVDSNGTYLPYEDSNGNVILNDETGKVSSFMKYDNKKGTYGRFSGLAFNNSGNMATFGSIYVGAFSTSSPYLNNLVDNEFAFYLKDMMLVKKDK